MNGPAAHTATPQAPDWDAVRRDFPLLMREVHGKPLVYFDNANTGQKPLQVIAATDAFYRRHNANVSRAVHAPRQRGHRGLRRRTNPAGAGFLTCAPTNWCCAAAPPSR